MGVLPNLLSVVHCLCSYFILAMRELGLVLMMAFLASAERIRLGIWDWDGMQGEM